MTTLRTKKMGTTTKLASLVMAVAVSAVLGVAMAPEAKADVKVAVKGRIQTPIGDVIVRTTNRAPVVRVRRPTVVIDRKPPVIVRHHPVKLTLEDQRVAWRLSYLTSIQEERLLHLRREGWSWREIARFYDIGRPVLRTALSQKRFDLHVAQVRCGNPGFGNGHGDWHGNGHGDRHDDERGHRGGHGNGRGR